MNWPGLTPLAPRTGPRGGAGVADPPGAMILNWSMTSFLAMYSYLLPSPRADNRPASPFRPGKSGLVVHAVLDVPLAHRPQGTEVLAGDSAETSCPGPPRTVPACSAGSYFEVRTVPPTTIAAAIRTRFL